ncbi:MAG TPA: hypothetical protein PLU30_01830 [Verrucomicrobiae bacterium]|nr:hypothetical protein [Verrucomicrobiae bacterium]
MAKVDTQSGVGATSRSLRPPVMRASLIALFGAVTVLSPDLSLAIGGRPKASLRIHFEVSPNLPEKQRIMYQLQNPKIEIAVGKFPELWEKHLLAVEAFPGTPGAVLLRFDDHGKRVLMFLTEANRGRRMLVVVNGRPVFAPTVDATLPNGQLVVPSGISPQEFQDLQRIAKKNKHRDESM